MVGKLDFLDGTFVTAQYHDRRVWRAKVPKVDQRVGAAGDNYLSARAQTLRCVRINHARTHVIVVLAPVACQNVCRTRLNGQLRPHLVAVVNVEFAVTADTCKVT